MKQQNELKNVILLRYHFSNDYANTWGPLVVWLERHFGAIAFPGYDVLEVKPGIFEHKIRTNASTEDITECIQMMYLLKSDGTLPCFISATIKSEES